MRGVGWLVITCGLLLANAFFVAAEFALVKVRGARIEDLARRGSPLARVARKVINNLDTSLAAAQLGVTLASLGLGWSSGDLILAVDGKRVHNREELEQEMKRFRPGDTVYFSVLRERSGVRQIPVHLAEYPDTPPTAMIR